MNKKLILSFFLIFNILVIHTTKPILSEAISAVLIYRYIITPFLKINTTPTKQPCTCNDKIKRIEQFLMIYGITLIDLKKVLTELKNNYEQQQKQIDSLIDAEIDLEDAIIDTAKEIKKIENNNENILYRS